MSYLNRTFKDKTTIIKQPSQDEVETGNRLCRWHQPLDTSDNIIGINDSSYYTFRDSRYEGLAREILQNSIDEQLDKEKPVLVEFSLTEVKTKDIPDYKNYKSLYENGYKSWKNDNQPNGKVFFEEALNTLSKDKIKVMRISDFNTNGVIGSQTTEILSANDITPWNNLLKSEGSSSKGDTQGGSFGIGKNATFANSILRTVFYSTYDKENVKSYEGVAKLATVFKSNERLSAKCYYGEIQNDKSNAIRGLLEFTDYERFEYGTDIYILGFEEDDFWDIRMIKTILSDFIIPIHNNDLEVNMNGEIISKETLPTLYKKYLEYCNNNRKKSIGTEIQSSKNYYEVITSSETLEFDYDIKNLGKAHLKVLYNPDFERKILRTRETGMKLFDAGGVSSTIGFSGIVTLEGVELNKLFREMENPAHTKWSADNIANQERRKLGEATRKALNRWMREEVINNATDKETENLEIEGLDEYLPSNFINNQEDEKNVVSENISSIISSITIRKSSRKEEINNKHSGGIKASTGKEEDGGELGEKGKAKNKNTKNKGGKNRGDDIRIGKGSEFVFRKVPSNNFKVRVIKQSDKYILKLQVKKDIENAKLEVFIAGENSNTKPLIEDVYDGLKNIKYTYKYNRIKLGNIIRDDKLTINLKITSNSDNALEVYLYEGKRK